VNQNLLLSYKKNAILFIKLSASS